MALSVKTDAGKVAGEISSEMMPKATISDIAKAGANLILRYNFDYQGNPVPVVITLTPTADKVGAHLSFAGRRVRDDRHGGKDGQVSGVRSWGLEDLKTWSLEVLKT